MEPVSRPAAASAAAACRDSEAVGAFWARDAGTAAAACGPTADAGRPARGAAESGPAAADGAAAPGRWACGTAAAGAMVMPAGAASCGADSDGRAAAAGSVERGASAVGRETVLISAAFSKPAAKSEGVPGVAASSSAMSARQVQARRMGEAGL